LLAFDKRPACRHHGRKLSAHLRNLLLCICLQTKQLVRAQHCKDGELAGSLVLLLLLLLLLPLTVQECKQLMPLLVRDQHLLL
jgi:hypothetical protein